MKADTKVKRLSERGTYDREVLNGIIDQALVCHVAFSVDGVPYNIPMSHVRIDSDLFIHASISSRFYRELSKGSEVCITITHVDGIVLAKSASSSSVNYRSAMLFGKMSPVIEKEEKMRVAEKLVEKMAEGRWQDCRHPSDSELQVTGFLTMPIQAFSAKVRAGPPNDKETDLNLPYWSGVIPVSTVKGRPVSSASNSGKPEAPDYILESVR